MKTKKMNAKLVLNKSTVENLEQVSMNEVKGGTVGTGITCGVCDSNASCYIARCKNYNTVFCP